MLKTRVIVLIVVAVMFTLSGVARASVCPSGGTPPANSTVNGGLEVDGTCVIDNVTVNGGITVEKGGHLQLVGGTVNGGIEVLPCGEIDINATTNGAGAPTGTNAAIHGDIDIEADNVCPSEAFSDVDIFTAKIDGGISITGTFPNDFFPYICGNEIKGSIHVVNVNVTQIGQFEGAIGDPDGALRSCPGNKISGSLHMRNSAVFAVESNTIGGSVLLSASRLELNGNTIHGSLRCSNVTTILPRDGSDPLSNTVHGKDTCH